jgi:DNA-directed RNA polymerase specialized sigma24 family protein
VLHLRLYVARVFPDLDPDDVVQGTLTRLLERSERLASTPVEHAWGYLLGATRNAAIDAIRSRRRQRQVPLDAVAEPASSEDAIAQLIDRDASRSAVVESLRTYVDAGDKLTVRIITVWLDVADELGRAPSTREVAARAGVSHTSVATALTRFRGRMMKGA